MTAEPVVACGSDSCPVPQPTGQLMARLRSVVLDAGVTLRRGHKTTHPDPSVLVAGIGNTRFAPLDGIAHAYLATNTFADLLESALHEAAPPDPRIYGAQLRSWQESAVSLTAGLRLVDLRDPELERLGIARPELVATDPSHYPCTRVWASALHGRRIGGQLTHGAIWNSRQRELHAAAMVDRPALQDLIAEAPAEVIVLWSPPAATRIIEQAEGGLGNLANGSGWDYLADSAALLGITVP